MGLFPLIVKKKLIHEVAQVLTSNTPYQIDPTTPLTSPSHVNWAMEVLAQGFNLPIEEHVIINEALVVYSAWLLKIDQRPIAIQKLAGSETEQVFVQVRLDPNYRIF